MKTRIFKYLLAILGIVFVIAVVINSIAAVYITTHFTEIQKCQEELQRELELTRLEIEREEIRLDSVRVEVDILESATALVKNSFFGGCDKAREARESSPEIAQDAQEGNMGGQ